MNDDLVSLLITVYLAAGVYFSADAAETWEADRMIFPVSWLIARFLGWLFFWGLIFLFLGCRGVFRKINMRDE